VSSCYLGTFWHQRWGNLGVDAYISGTVAAVREAAIHRIPGIAVSHYRQGKRNVDWDVAAQWTARVFASLLSRPSEPGTFWNVNLPHLEPGDPDPEVVFCQASTQPLPVNYRIEGEDFITLGNMLSAIALPVPMSMSVSQAALP
jgi:5'-nucleotidase